MKKAAAILLMMAVLLSMTGCSILEKLPVFGEKTETFEFTGTVWETEQETGEDPEEPADRRVPVDIPLLDQEDVQVRMTGYEMPNAYNTYMPVFYLSAHNGTDRKLKVILPYLAINGYEMLTVSGEEAKPGETVEVTVRVVDTDYMKIYPFRDYETLTVQLQIWDKEENGNYLLPDPVKVTMPGITHTHIEHDESGNVFYEDNGVKAVFRRFTEEENGDVRYEVYIHNQRKDYLIVENSDFMINGEPMDGDFSLLVQPGMRLVQSATTSKRELERAGIGEARNIEMAFRFFTREKLEDEDIPLAETEPVREKLKAYQPAIPETVLFDADGVRVTAYDYVETQILYNTLKVRMENRSSTKKEIWADQITVNGLAFETNSLGGLWEFLEAGEEGEEDIMIPHSSLDIFGIREVKTLGMQVHCREKDGEETTYGEYATIRLQDGTGEYTAPAAVMPLTETGGVKVSLVGAQMLKYGKEAMGLGSYMFGVSLLFENSGKKPVAVRTQSAGMVDGKKKEDIKWLDIIVPAGGAAAWTMYPYTGENERVDSIRFGLEVVSQDRKTVIAKSRKLEIRFK